MCSKDCYRPAWSSVVLKECGCRDADAVAHAMCREAVRDTWMQDAEKNGVLARFILTEEERNPAVEEVCTGHQVACTPFQGQTCQHSHHAMHVQIVSGQVV